MSKTPELLSPAGSFDALLAAVESGADAVYMGGVGFNARMHAKNFGESEMREAIRTAHLYGVKVYITANTLVSDREANDFLRAAGSALDAGADALIVADLGGAALLHRVFPTAALHASTQMSGHSVSAALELQKIGFSRMVLARETSKENIAFFTAHAPIEAEVFVHGALCVCHSGQCLFSSLVGGRSGNRGECAQPCRLPYSVNGKEAYPLSLKDLSLAGHLSELCDLGVASLKIEGRMKSPEYVRDVTAVYRRLLDERRNATPEEMRFLADIFSRGGFTDGYFTGKIGHGMMGVRREEDKERSRASVPFTGLTRKIPVTVSAVIARDAPMTLTLSAGDGIAVTVTGDIPPIAQNSPTREENVRASLTKFGGTPFAVKKDGVDLTYDGTLLVPVSRLNALRREAVEKLTERLLPSGKSFPIPEKGTAELSLPQGKKTEETVGVFRCPEQLTEKARSYFDRAFLPLSVYDGSAVGVILPAVIFDSEREKVREALGRAIGKGARDVLVGNLGHLSLVREFLPNHPDLRVTGDLRLNAYNRETVAALEKCGVSSVILSPELTLPQMRDIGGKTLSVVYGRLPLMILEKCVGKEISDCRACEEDRVTLVDRRGVKFPVLRETADSHRSVIENSVPVYTADRGEELSRHGVRGRVFLFTDETPEEVDGIVEAYRRGTPPQGAVRRM